jgi:uncharacterized protein (DUF1697 family)
MRIYIALLRGINVSGHKIIKMEILRKVLEELDFKNISTYIQSGNILFESDVIDVSILEHQIADKIEEHFGFLVPVTIVTLEELKMIVEKNPFSNQKMEDPAQPYVAFLSESPTPAAIKVLGAIDFGNDRFINIDKTLYLFYANSAANTKLNNVVIENKLKLKATSRNWKTVHKLIDLAMAMTGK